MTNSFYISEIIAASALVVSIITVVITIKFNNRQKSINETQEELNQLLIQEKVDKKNSEKKAQLGAKIYRERSNSYRLKIWNEGKCPASNVFIEFPDGNDYISVHEITPRFPCTLNPSDSIELIVDASITQTNRINIRLTWSDNHDQKNEKNFSLHL